jgi:fibronectin-binding autotransporter adhesin
MFAVRRCCDLSWLPAFVVAALAITSPVHGQTSYEWRGTTSTDPTVAANWFGTAFTAFNQSSNSRLNIYNGTSASTALEYTAAQGTTTLASAARPLVIGNTGNAGGRLLITGGTLSLAGATQPAVIGTNGTDGAIEITGGLFQGSAVVLEMAGLANNNPPGPGTGTITISGGEAVIPLISVSNNASSVATFNLNGGTFTLGALTVGTLANSSIRFNGGTLRPSFASATFLQNFDAADVRNGGAVIDTAGFATTIAQALRHSVIAGDAAIDGGLRKLGSGTLTLSGSNTFTGPTVVEAGTLLLGNSAALSASTFNTASAGTLSFGSLTSATFGGLSGSGGLVLENADPTPAAVTLSLGGGNTASSYGGNLSGAGGLEKVGTGTLTLSGTNSYSGNTAVNAGTLAITSIAALPGYETPGRVSVAANAMLLVPNAVDNVAVAAILSNGSFASNARIGFDTAASNRTYATAITGSKALFKAGANTLTISGSNTLGAIRVMGGTLKATSEAAWGGSGDLILNDGTFEYVPPTATAGSLSRTVTLEGNGSLRIDSPSVDTQFQVGAIAGTGQLTLLGGNGLFVRSAGSYTGGTIVKPGVRVAVIGSSSGTAGAPTGGPFGTGTLRLEGGGLRSTTSGERTIGNVTTLAGNVEFISAGANQDQNLVFSGPMTIEGATRTLTVNSSVNTGAGATGIFFNGIIGDGGNTLGLTKAGPGMLVLAGANTYGGATTVSAGTLRVNGNQSAAGGAVSVATGATFGGSGTVGGATTISGIHTPGNSPGVQAFASNLSYTGGSASVVWELTGNTSAQGSPTAAYDQVVVGGNLDFAAATSLSLVFNDSGSTVAWNNPFWNIDQTWTLYDVAGTTSNLGNFTIQTASWLDSTNTAFATARPNASFSLTQSGEDVLLSYVAVPEPESMAVVAAGLAAVAAAFRRRRAADRA